MAAIKLQSVRTSGRKSKSRGPTEPEFARSASSSRLVLRTSTSTAFNSIDSLAECPSRSARHSTLWPRTTFAIQFLSDAPDGANGLRKRKMRIRKLRRRWTGQTKKNRRVPTQTALSHRCDSAMYGFKRPRSAEVSDSRSAFTHFANPGTARYGNSKSGMEHVCLLCEASRATLQAA